MLAFQPQSESKAPPRSIEWCEIAQRYPLANDVLASIASLCIFSQGYQIQARIRIKDFEAQQFASPCCAGSIRSVMNNSEPDVSVEKQTPNNLEAHNCAVPCSAQDCIITSLYEPIDGVGQGRVQHSSSRRRPSINTLLLGNQQTLFRFIEILRAEW
jgi:hypothetical protein